MKYPKTGSGTSEGEETPASWPFWPAMDLAVGQQDNINPPELLCSSSGISVRGESYTPMSNLSPSPSASYSETSTECSSSPTATPRASRQLQKKRKAEVVQETCVKINDAIKKFEEQNVKFDKLLDALINKYC